MTIEVGQMPYLNSVLFYLDMPREEVKLHPMDPTIMAKAAHEGFLDAGPIPLVECFRLEDDFEPLGNFCIATTKQARSILLFSKKPVEQLEGQPIGVTDETSTSAQLLKILLLYRYGLSKPQFVRLGEAYDAFLLIGDGALKQRRGIAGYDYHYDLGEIWNEWTGLPTVFALWVARKTLAQEAKSILETAITRGLERGWTQMAEITAQNQALGMSQNEITEYLNGFSFKVGAAELAAIEKFRGLVNTLE